MAGMDDGVLTLAGRDAAHAMTLLVPPAWENDSDLSPEVRAFFEYQSGLMEPWDGPALLVFTDGRVVAAALDRNGLRPARSVVTVDGLVLVASEVGVLDVEDDRVLHRGRLGPGDMVAVDLAARRFLDREIFGIPMSLVLQYGIPVLSIPLLVVFKYGKPGGYLMDWMSFHFKPRVYCCLEPDSEQTRNYLTTGDGQSWRQ